MFFDVEKTNELREADGQTLAKEAVKVLIEKLALDVTMYNVFEHTSVTDYYVNATGRSSTHVASLADDVADHFELRGQSPLRIEGKKGNSWILVDFGTLIVNIFDSEGRAFYNFDRLLPEECKESIDLIVAEVDKKYNLDKKDN